jgi:hypothetical protein
MTAQQLRHIHLALAAAWATIGTAYTLLWGAESILWIGLISVYAIVISHLAAYDAARAEDS